MITVDTHAFTWWRTGSPKLGADARRVLERHDEIGIADIVLWEIAMMAERGALKLKASARDWINDALKDPRVVVLPITPAIAILAVAIGRAIHRDPADALIAATAMAHGVPLVSKDSGLEAIVGLEVIW